MRTTGSRFSLIAALALFCCGTAVQAQLAERVVTLEESITAGMHNSQELLAVREQVAIAQQRVGEAKSQIYPKIDFNFSASKFNSDFPTVLAPSFSSLYLPTGNEDQYFFTRFSLWQYLYAGGRYTTNLRLAEINLSQAQSQVDVVQNRIINEVRTAFYACLVSRKKIQAYEQALAGAKGAPSEARLRRELEEQRHRFEKDKLAFLSTAGLDTGVPGAERVFYRWGIDPGGRLRAADDLPDLVAALRSTRRQQSVERGRTGVDDVFSAANLQL
jgi:hypothetical protein